MACICALLIVLGVGCLTGVSGLASYDHIMGLQDVIQGSLTHLTQPSVFGALKSVWTMSLFSKFNGCWLSGSSVAFELEDKEYFGSSARNDATKQNILSLGGPFQVSDLYVVQSAVFMTDSTTARRERKMESPSNRHLRQEHSDEVDDINEYELHRRDGDLPQKHTPVRPVFSLHAMDTNSGTEKLLPTAEPTAAPSDPPPTFEPTASPTNTPTTIPPADQNEEQNPSESGESGESGGDGGDEGKDNEHEGERTISNPPTDADDEDDGHTPGQGSTNTGDKDNGSGEETEKTSSGRDFLDPRGDIVLVYFLVILGCIILIVLVLYCRSDSSSNPRELYRGNGARTSPGRAVDPSTGGRDRNSGRVKRYSWFGFSHDSYSTSAPRSSSPLSMSRGNGGNSGSHSGGGRHKLRHQESLGELRPLAGAMDEVDLP